jgi:hypothetical protein
VYGTLLFPEVVRALIGREPDRTAGTVAGWRAAALPGRPYPGLVPAAGATAGGQLLTGLTHVEWRIIEAFENGGYELTELTLTDGRHGWAYAYAESLSPLPEDWSAAEFGAHRLADFVAHCTAWRRHHEAAGRPDG